LISSASSTGEDPAEVGAGQGRPHRACPGRQHQLVVRELAICAGLAAVGIHDPVLAVDAGGDGLVVYVDVLDVVEEHLVAQRAGRRGHELFLVLDEAADVVGQAAACVGEEDTLLQQRDVRVRVEPHDPRGRLGTGGHGADDDDASAGRHATSSG
jgi:hypothetical protein